MDLPKRGIAAVPAVTRGQMEAIDRLMTEDLGIALIQMMENAGLWLAELARRLAPDGLHGSRFLVAAGTGNNGGGGLAAARRLHAWGAGVEVVTTADGDAYHGVPGQQLRAIRQMGVPVRIFDGSLPPHDLVLDAIIGYGLHGPPEGHAAALIDAVNLSPAPAVSLDAPSGLDVDSGTAPGAAVRAAATLMLALPKAGLVRPAAAPFAGELYLADLGVPRDAYARIGIAVSGLFDGASLLRLG